MRPTSAPGAPPKGSPSRRHPPSTPRPDSARTSGGRDVRAVQLIATRGSARALRSRDCVRNCASASCTSRSSRSPSTSDVGDPSRAKTSATWPPAKRDRGAVRRSASSIVTGTTITPSPPRAPMAAHYVGHQSLPSAANARVALAARRGPARRSSRGAPAVDALASAPRHPAAIATWSARPARGAARGDRAARAGGGDRVGSASRRVARGMAARAVAPCQRNVPLGRSRAGMSRPAPGTRTALNLPRLRRNECAGRSHRLSRVRHLGLARPRGTGRCRRLRRGNGLARSRVAPETLNAQRSRAPV